VDKHESIKRVGAAITEVILLARSKK